jgi:anti-sigma-K factor RskA
VSAHREDHLELAAGWLLDILSEAEAQEFEEHLGSGCPICRDEIARLSQATVALASSAAPARPPAVVRERLMAVVRAEAADGAGSRAPASRESAEPPGARRVIPMPSARRTTFAWGWVAAAAVFAVASVGGWWTSVRLEEEAATLRTRLAKTQAELDEKRELLAVIGSPEARTAELAATPDAAAALRAHATFDPRTHTAVIVFQGLLAPGDRDFELWAVRGKEVASLGLVHADASGSAVVRVIVSGDSSGLDAFAVSLEKKGGSSSPTAPGGPIVMVGKLSG